MKQGLVKDRPEEDRLAKDRLEKDLLEAIQAQAEHRTHDVIGEPRRHSL